MSQTKLVANSRFTSLQCPICNRDRHVIVHVACPALFWKILCNGPLIFSVGGPEPKSESNPSSSESSDRLTWSAVIRWFLGQCSAKISKKNRELGVSGLLKKPRGYMLSTHFWRRIWKFACQYWAGDEVSLLTFTYRLANFSLDPENVCNANTVQCSSMRLGRPHKLKNLTIKAVKRSKHTRTCSRVHIYALVVWYQSIGNMAPYRDIFTATDFTGMLLCLSSFYVPSPIIVHISPEKILGAATGFFYPISDRTDRSGFADRLLHSISILHYPEILHVMSRQFLTQLKLKYDCAGVLVSEVEVQLLYYCYLIQYSFEQIITFAKCWIIKLLWHCLALFCNFIPAPGLTCSCVSIQSSVDTKACRNCSKLRLPGSLRVLKRSKLRSHARTRQTGTCGHGNLPRRWNHLAFLQPLCRDVYNTTHKLMLSLKVSYRQISASNKE